MLHRLLLVWTAIHLEALLHLQVSSRHVDHLSARVVSTRYGSLRGLNSILPNRRLQAVEVFLGVPYAGAPEGPLRFMPPVTSPHWKGVRVADRHGPVCPQQLPPLGNETEALKRMPAGRYRYLRRLLPYLTNQSEDCLYLNIYVPTSAQRNASKLAVMVYIHGESYEWNSGNPYDGRVLASYGNVIVVTVNYRLGVLGFLPTVDQSARGNYGLMDQVAALHWIQDNVAEFGGDVRNITVFGQGHGAACVNLLMLSPMARGLFHRAIMQSGSATSPWAIARDSVSHAQHLAAVLDCPVRDSTAMVECLRARSLRDILAVPLQVPDFLAGFGPTVDGIVLPRDPADIMQTTEEGLFSRYDLLFGTTRVESYFRFSAADQNFGIDGSRRDRLLRTLMRNVYTHHLQEIFLTVVNEYMDWSRSYLQPTDILEATLDVLGDATVVAPVVRAGNLHSSRLHLDSMYPFPLSSLDGRKSYFYVFSHQTEYGDYPVKLGCVSGEDLAYVFGAPMVDSLAHFGANYTRAEATLAEIVMTHWTNFAKVGDPNIGTVGHGSGSPSDNIRGRYERTMWPAYDPINQKYLSISMKPRVRDHYHAHRLSYWLHLIPRLHDAAFGNASLPHDRLADHDDPDTYEGVVRRQRRPPTTPAPEPRPSPTHDANHRVPVVPMSPAGNSTGTDERSGAVSITVKIEEGPPPAPKKTAAENATAEGEGGGAEWLAARWPLLVTVAVGGSLVALNAVVFVAICRQRERECFEKRLHEAYAQHERGAATAEAEKPFLVKDLSTSFRLNPLCPHQELDGGQALDLVRHSGGQYRCVASCQGNRTLVSKKPAGSERDGLQAWPQERKQYGTDSHC